jgi:hypothetical protein
LVYLKNSSNTSFQQFVYSNGSGEYSITFPVNNPLLPNNNYYIETSIFDSQDYDGIVAKNIGGETVDSDINQNQKTDLITVAVDQTYPNIDAGYYYKDKATISGRLFKDINKNNYYDTGDVLANGYVYLKRVGDTSFQRYYSVGSNGEYTFSFSNSDDFPANTYYIEPHIYDNYNFDGIVAKNIGGATVDSDINQDGKTDPIVAIVNTTISNIDAGYYSTDKLNVHGKVFNDVNKNNILDVGDGFLQSYIQVYNRTNNSFVTDTYSDSATGEYDLNIIPGDYYLVINPPDNSYLGVSKNVGGSTEDSDIDPITHRTNNFVLTLGDSTQYFDAGYYLGEADLSIVKTSSGGSDSSTGNQGTLSYGDLIYYNLMVTNNGPDSTSTSGTYVTDVYDNTRLIFDHATGSGITSCYESNYNQITCDYTAPLINGQVDNIKLYFIVKE